MFNDLNEPLDCLINARETQLESVQEVLQPRLGLLGTPPKTAHHSCTAFALATSLLSCVVLFDNNERNCLFFSNRRLGKCLECVKKREVAEDLRPEAGVHCECSHSPPSDQPFHLQDPLSFQWIQICAYPLTRTELN
jgi:hypothetical protein